LPGRIFQQNGQSRFAWSHRTVAGMDRCRRRPPSSRILPEDRRGGAVHKYARI